MLRTGDPALEHDPKELPHGCGIGTFLHDLGAQLGMDPEPGHVIRWAPSLRAGTRAAACKWAGPHWVGLAAYMFLHDLGAQLGVDPEPGHIIRWAPCLRAGAQTASHMQRHGCMRRAWRLTSLCRPGAGRKACMRPDGVCAA